MNTRVLNVLTTLLHLTALNSALPTQYNALILAATLTSALWHANNEQSRWLGALDYGLAGLWFLVDTTGSLWTVPLNLAVFAAFTTMKDHALWHCLSAAKAAAVSHYLLAR